MFLLYNILGIDKTWHLLRWDLSVSKLLTQVLVLVGNYVVSKWFVFT